MGVAEEYFGFLGMIGKLDSLIAKIVLNLTEFFLPTAFLIVLIK